MGLTIRILTINNAPSVALLSGQLGYPMSLDIARRRIKFLAQSDVDEIYGAFEGKGVGKQLIAVAKKWCEEHSCQTLRVRSNVVRQDAHRFYLSAGFKEMKEQKVFGLPG